MPAPELATGDGALGFWQALHQVWPGTRQQRSMMASSTGPQDRQRPKRPAKVAAQQGEQDLHAIYEAENRAKAEVAFDRFVVKYGAKYGKAATCLTKDREALLAFYDFPAEPLGRLSLPSCGTDHRRCR